MSRLPLWMAMVDAPSKATPPGSSYQDFVRNRIAAEIRAVADEIESHPEVNVADWLRTEADKAETGE